MKSALLTVSSAPELSTPVCICAILIAFSISDMVADMVADMVDNMSCFNLVRELVAGVGLLGPNFVRPEAYVPDLRVF